MRAQKPSLPPRIFGSVIALLGIVLAVSGTYLLILGGSPYYVLAGLAMVASGIWFWRGDERGAWLFGGVLVATVVWALLEVGTAPFALFPRVALLALLGLWMALPIARRGLAWRAGSKRPSPRWAVPLSLAAVLAAAALGPPVRPPSAAEEMVDAPPTRPAPMPGQADTDWTNFGHDISGNRFVPSTRITSTNVNQLKLAWSYRTGDMPAEPYADENTPLKIGKRLIVCTPRRWVIALDATTGRPLWRFKPPQDTLPMPFPKNCRGVSYHAGTGRIFVSSFRGQLWALDFVTGRPTLGFGQGGAVSLLHGLGAMTARDWANTTPGVVIGDVIVLGAKVTDEKSIDMPSGVVRAFDVHTGKLAWAWDVGKPDRTGAPAPGETYTRSTPNAWAGFAADPALSLVFVPTANGTPDFFGGYRRPFDEKYTMAIVALDARTGIPRWSFQTVHHDLWDLDLPAQPLLVDWPTSSGPRKAVVTFSKTGDIFVLDRATGQPIVPVKEVPVSLAGGAPEDHPSPTQRASALSLAPRPLREADMWGLTLFDQLACRITYRQSRYTGEYTLPGTTPSLSRSMQAGVFTWSGGTVDPRNNILVVNARYLPYQGRLLRRAPGDTRILSTTETGLVEMAGTPYRYTSRGLSGILGVPCTQPPWGELVGIDMRTAKVIWRKPLGTAEAFGPFGVASGLPFNIGTSAIGASVITASGLAFQAGTPDRYLRAIDVRTGRELWRTGLPAGGNATPMTYDSGERQFVVIAAGGSPYMKTTRGDYILAYSLPESR